MQQDLWGNDLTAEESQLLDVYEKLRALARDAVTPCVVANVRTALAPVAVAVTDLGLRFEHLVDEGV
ncbi:DUF6052 family protein [Kineosporia sp. NBRC 101731]|uniref:DUF6052 family protein n=1 Tax=Kineosporia sp. NBRC 101731 TaxID=3032199 RepID=UPI0024A45E12|nr:DUF6052 family protein [Kineosporia sp. NBRC 101731]GLY31041.1 hypothetical protein Kisp02_44060 [Kineosporia sp. NBRC 101731]